MTHGLRASHEAILVGIGTVIADDPSLSVRLVPGADPLPVILDSNLRMPLSSRLLSQGRVRPLIVTSDESDRGRRASLEAAGARVISAPMDEEGRLSLPALLGLLSGLGIGSVLVEGGAAVLRAFLAARLVDELIVTIAPRLLGGLNPFSPDGRNSPSGLPCSLADSRAEILGRDLILRGRPLWDQPGLA